MNFGFTNASEMLWETGFSEENDTMPQTVPTSGQSPPSSSTGAPCGGSALAGRERAVPDAQPPPPTPPTPTELFHELPSTLLDADIHMLKQHTLPTYHTQAQQITFDSVLDPYKNSQIDYRRFTNDLSSYCTEEPEEVLRNTAYDNSAASLLEQFYNFGYRSPQYPTPSPSSEEGSVCLPPSINIQPCSPQYTHDTHSTVSDISAPIFCTVKEEPSSNHLHLSPNCGSPYPLSPSGSCTSYYSDHSPACTSVSSPSQFQDEFIDIEQLLKGNDTSQATDCDQRLGESQIDECSALLTPKEEIREDIKPRDHRLLREVLEDTSFQKRLNLKPIQLNGYSEQIGELHSLVKMEEGECDDEELLSPRTNALTSEKIDQVLSLAIEQTRKDVDNTCNVLGISPEPTTWNWTDVQAWLTFTTRQFSLPSLPLEFVAPMDGAALVGLSEEDFNRLAPQGGSTLYAQLEIWKAARASSCPWSTAAHDENSDDEDMESSVAAPGVAAAVGSTNGKARTGGAHIHLWQFLKELLGAPQLHGSAIRWLDRGNGVFKIEDSVRVARLWGKRKNRPAMNYDKLSRSIRQYYKKGIMKKTERSQRLVYQFCHPYCL